MNRESSANEWRDGWRVVVSGTLGYGTGIGMFLMTARLFINPMQAELGWSKSAVTLASTLILCMGLTGPAVGALTDRWGGRPVMILGLLLLTIGFLGLAIAPATPMAIYLLTIFIGAAGPMSSATPTARGIVGWFRKRTGTALGIALNGTSIVALATVPLVAMSIDRFGWRGGFLALAGVSMLIGLPVIVTWFRTPGEPVAIVQETPRLEGKTFSEALRDWRYWTIVFTVALGTIAASGGSYERLRLVRT